MADEITPVVEADEFGVEITDAPPLNPSQPSTKKARGIQNYVTGSLTLSTIINYLAQAAGGTIRYQDEMFDLMIERDPHLQAVLQTRRLSLTQAQWQIMPGDEDDPRSIDAAEDIRDQLSAYDGFDDALQGLLDAIPKGTAAAEIIYNDDWSLDRLVEIPGRMLDWTTGDLQIIQNGTTEPMEPNKFIRHSPRLKPGSIQRRGLMRALSIYWCISHYAMEDWAGFVEVFGMPVRVGRYDGDKSKGSDIDVLKTAIKGLGTDAAAILPKSMDIEFIEPMRTGIPGGGTPMQSVIDHIEKKISITVLGQNITTQSESGSGTLAGNAGERTVKSLTRGDAVQLNLTLRRDLFRPIVGFRHGFDVALPHLRFDLDDQVNTEARGKIYSLAKEIGVETSASQFREEMGLLEPTDADDTIEPTADDWQAVQFSKRVDLAKIERTADDANDSLASAADKDGKDFTRAVLDKAVELSQGMTPEAMLKRITSGGDLHKTLGIDTGDVEDLTARTQITGDLNGHIAVKDELDA